MLSFINDRFPIKYYNVPLVPIGEQNKQLEMYPVRLFFN